MEYFTANVRDAIAALEALAASGVEPPADHAQVAPRLLERLHRLSADASRRACVFEEAAGPDTLLHGDLWPVKIGRASCRERVEISVVAVSLKKKKRMV